MDTKQLKAELDLLNVLESSYDLNGKLLPDRIVLGKSFNGKWTTLYFDERGNEHDRVEFDTEDEACRHVFEIFNHRFDYQSRDLPKILRNLYSRGYIKLFQKRIFFLLMRFKLPEQFNQFYHRYNGMFGKIGQHTMVDFWQSEKILKANKADENKIYRSAYYLFGDVNGQLLAFGKKAPGIFMLEQISGEPKAIFLADDYHNLVLALFDRDKGLA